MKKKRLGQRPCGGCTACCSIFGVKVEDEVWKAPWVTCEHLEKPGCGIYQERPQTCREFNCLWVYGIGKRTERPDLLGAVFATSATKTEFTGEYEFQAYEVFPGAFGKKDVVALAKVIAGKKKLIVGFRYGGEVLTFIGPPEKIRAAQEWMKEHGGNVL